MRMIQGLILVALVVIAGLLYSISRKMDNQAPAPAATAATTAAVGQAVGALPGAQLAPAQPAQAPAPAAPPSPSLRLPAPRRVAPVTRYSAPAPPAPPAYTSTEPAYTPAPPAAPAPPAPPPVRTLTVPAGTAIAVRLLDAISTERNRAGDTFQASLEEPLIVDGVVIAQRNAMVMGRVVQAKESGRVAGLAEMALELNRITTVAGDVPIASDTMMRQAEPSKGKDAATMGAMAGIGAAIGAIAGGRRGAGIGAASGGAAGAGTVMATRGKPVKFDPETRLTFRLKAPLTVTAENGRLQAAPEVAPYEEQPDRPVLRRRPTS